MKTKMTVTLLMLPTKTSMTKQHAIVGVPQSCTPRKVTHFRRLDEL